MYSVFVLLGILIACNSNAFEHVKDLMHDAPTLFEIPQKSIGFANRLYGFIDVFPLTH